MEEIPKTTTWDVIKPCKKMEWATNPKWFSHPISSINSTISPPIPTSIVVTFVTSWRSRTTCRLPCRFVSRSATFKGKAWVPPRKRNCESGPLLLQPWKESLRGKLLALGVSGKISFWRFTVSNTKIDDVYPHWKSKPDTRLDNSSK